MSNPTREIDFPVTYCGNCLIVKLPQRLTLKESISLKESCSESIKQNKAGQKVILDFKDTQLIDSSGIGALIRIHKVARVIKCQTRNYRRMASQRAIASHISNFEDVIELDLRYQKKWSFFYDLRLIFKTILIIFNKNSGAV